MLVKFLICSRLSRSCDLVYWALSFNWLCNVLLTMDCGLCAFYSTALWCVFLASLHASRMNVLFGDIVMFFALVFAGILRPMKISKTKCDDEREIQMWLQPDAITYKSVNSLCYISHEAASECTSPFSHSPRKIPNTFSGGCRNDHPLFCPNIICLFYMFTSPTTR